MSLSRRALLSTLAASAAVAALPGSAEAASRATRNRPRTPAPTTRATATPTVAPTRSVAPAPSATPTPTAPVVPSAAAAAGMSKLAFADDFTSTASIDLKATGAAGFNWYTSGVHAWGQPDTPAADLSISNSVLTINPSRTNFNMNISTADANTGRGRTFGHGYFEARMKFPVQSAPAPMTADGRFAWPSFWAESQAHILGTKGSQPAWGELDFFEACVGPKDFVGTLHDWGTRGSGSHVQNANNTTPTQADFTQWHTFGCLWQPGSVSWFLDGQLVHRQTWTGSANPMPYDANLQPYSAAFDILDIEPGRGGMNVILGSGIGRPMSIDWVRIWTA